MALLAQSSSFSGRIHSFLFTLGWILFFLGALWGNTLVGIFFLLLDLLFFPRSQPWFPLRSSIAWPVRLFLGIMLVGALLSPYPGLSLAATIGFALLLQVTLLGSQRLAEKTSLANLVPFLCVSGSTAAAVSLWRYFSLNLARATLPTVGENGLGTLLLAGIMITLGYYEALRERWRYLLLPALALQVVALVFTYSRGAWLGFLAALLVYFGHQWRRLLALILLLSLFFGMIGGIEHAGERFSSIFSLAANEDRVHIWQTTFNMIKAHPLLGVGVANFPRVYHSYRVPGEERLSLAFAHNIFLQVAAETGLLGLMAFLTLLGMILAAGLRHWRSGNPLFLGLFAAWLGILIHEQFDCIIYGFNTGSFFWLLSGLLVHLPSSAFTPPALMETNNPAAGKAVPPPPAPG